MNADAPTLVPGTDPRTNLYDMVLQHHSAQVCVCAVLQAALMVCAALRGVDVEACTVGGVVWPWPELKLMASLIMML